MRNIRLKTSQLADLRMVPIAAAVWIGAWAAVTKVSSQAVTIGLVLAILMLVAGLLVKRWLLVGLALALFFAYLIGTIHHNGAKHTALVDYFGQKVSAQFELVSEVNILDSKPGRTKMATAEIKLDFFTAGGAKIQQRKSIFLIANSSLASQLAELAVGQHVTGDIVLAEPREPTSSSASARLVSEFKPVKQPTAPGNAINFFRNRLRSSVEKAPGLSAGLVPSLVVGDSSRLADRVKHDFKSTGLSHLTAVSGANLTLLISFLMAITKRVTKNHRYWSAIQLATIICYVALCRLEPSVVRAAAMAIIALACLGQSSDKRKGIRNLAVAVFVLLIFDPWLAISWGFGLSVSACAAILWWAVSWQQLLVGRWPRWLAEAVTIPLAAQIGTTALIVALSGQIPTLGLVANLLAAGFIGPVTTLGIMAGVVGLIWLPASYPIGWLAGALVQPVIWIAHLVAAMPGALIQVDKQFWLLTVPLSLIAGSLVKQVLVRKWLAGVLLLVLLCLTCLRLPVGQTKNWLLVFCDVGQGDMALLKTSERQAVVVDTGPDPEKASSCLKKFGVTQIPALILTHYHADHVGGLAGVIDSAKVGKIFVSKLSSPPAQVNQVNQLASRAGIAVATAYPGQQISVGKLKWLTISAGESAKTGESPDAETENNHSIIGIAHISGVKTLFTGDAGVEAQELLLASGHDLAVDIFKVPHHGSANQSADFIKATKAKQAIISCGKNNPFSHPAEHTLNLLSGQSMVISRTDTQSHIVIPPS